MPTYEKRHDDGTVLERTVTLPPDQSSSGYDEQMAALADDDSIPWHRVDDHQGDVNKPADEPATGQAATATVPPFAHNDHIEEV